jgi:hypothetical protein
MATRAPTRRFALALATALALGACGGGSGTKQVAGSGGATTGAAVTRGSGLAGQERSPGRFKVTDACALLTPAEVSVLIPDAKAEGTGGPPYVCVWKGRGPTTFLTITDVSDPASRKMARATLSRVGGQQVDGLGDAAVVFKRGGAGEEEVHVYVLAGPYGIELEAEFPAASSREGEADLVSLARTVVAHLPT